MNIFNDIWFKDCHNMALLSILKIYDIDIRCLLFNQFYYYDLREDKYITLNCINQDNVYSILQKNGLESFDYSNRVSAKDIKEIVEKSPIIIGIDCFYESIRKDCFLKRHMLHSIVVLRVTNDIAEIIDHPFFFSNMYSLYKIPINEIVNGHNCYLKNINNSEYIFKSLDKSCYIDGKKPALLYFKAIIPKEKIFLVNGYYNMIRDNSNLIINGIMMLEEYMKKCFKIAQNSQDEDYIKGLLDEINNIVISKKIEQYIWNTILEDEHVKDKIKYLINEIILNWTKLRNLFARILYGNSKEHNLDIKELVKKTQKKELEVYELIKI